MAGASALPFTSQGRVVARDRKTLQRMLQNLLDEEPARDISPVDLLSVMEARKLLGRLPAGAEHGHHMLIGRATLGATPVTLLLRRDGSRGWRVVSLSR
jgi:hypothetical protein